EAYGFGGILDLATIGEKRLRAFVSDFVAEGGALSVTPRLGTDLDKSVPFADGSSEQLAAAQPPLAVDGKGVVVCIIDLGCDFLHRNFRAGQTLATRLRFLDVEQPNGSFLE